MKFRKATLLISSLIMAISLIGCSDGSENADEDFLKAFGNALNSRWDYTENPESGDGNEATRILEATEIELEQLKQYSEQSFSDSELQALATEYISELENGVEIAKTYGSEDIYDDWEEHANARRAIVYEIVKNYEVTVDEKYESILNEIVNEGEDAKKNKEVEEEIVAIVESIKFEELPQEYESEFYDYEAIVENTTEHDLSVAINIILYDENGVNLGTEYAYADNWKAGTKVSLEFFTEEFETMEVELDYYELLD